MWGSYLEQDSPRFASSISRGLNEFVLDGLGWVRCQFLIGVGAVQKDYNFVLVIVVVMADRSVTFAIWHDDYEVIFRQVTVWFKRSNLKLIPIQVSV